jgi:formylmethanofuran dehydrogenase subunit E
LKLRSLTVRELEEAGITEEYCDRCGEVFHLTHFAHFVGKIVRLERYVVFFGHACCDPNCPLGLVGGKGGEGADGGAGR